MARSRKHVPAAVEPSTPNLAPTEVTDLYDCPKTIGRPRLPEALVLPGRVENDVTRAGELTPAELAFVDRLIDRALKAWSAE